MNKLQSDLTEIINNIHLEEGVHKAPVSGVFYSKHSQVSPYTKRRWHSFFAIVVQGCKEIILENKSYWGNEYNYTVTPVDLPVTSRIAEASPDKPFIAVMIEMNPLILSEVASKIEKELPKETLPILQPIFIGKADDKILEAFIRLIKLFQTPEDATVLGPLIIRELFYYLLKSPNGEAIQQFVRSGSKIHEISQVIYKLKSELKDEIDVTTLAKTANMSRSSFFKYFHDVTAMSPIQYQKRLRLLEARRLMIENDETAESSAFKVGYKSSSQFSREYSRMFGNSPIRDIIKMKDSNGLIVNE